MRNLIFLLGLAVVLMGCRRDMESPAVQQGFYASGIAAGSEKNRGHEPIVVAQQTVYVCKSKGATRYHLNKNCHGLQRCKHTIEDTTKKKAEAIGLTLCKHEY